MFSPFLAHWDCSRISSQHHAVTQLCWEPLHPHGQGRHPDPQLSNRKVLGMQIIIRYPPHFKSHNTEMLFKILPSIYAKKHPEPDSCPFPAITDTKGMPLFNQLTTHDHDTALPTQPGSFRLSNPAGHSHEYCDPTDTGKLWAISAFSCKIFLVWVASLPQKKGNCFQRVFSPKPNILI